MAEFKYQTPKPLGEDTTEYRLVTKDYVEVKECDGRRILKVAPEGLELLAKEAIADVSFYLRPSHLKKLASILAHVDTARRHVEQTARFDDFKPLVHQRGRVDGHHRTHIPCLI